MKGRLTGLDALRGVAALMVLVHNTWSNFFIVPVFRPAYLEVDFFFMLSGYVMARTYEDRFAEISTPEFLSIRYRRLWLPMAVGTAIGAAHFLGDGGNLGVTIILVLAGLIFVPTMYPERPFELNRAEWSIFFEVFANVAHRLLLWRLRTWQLGAIAAACLVAVIVYGGGNFDVGHREISFVGGFPRVLLGYSLGILIYRERLTLRAPLVVAYVALAAAPLLCGLAGVPFLFVVAVAPAVVMIGATQPAGRIGRAAGAMSFPLYAVHYPLLQVARAAHLGPYIGMALAITVAAALTVLSARLPTVAWRRARAAA